MSRCKLCKKDLDFGPNFGSRHQVCDDEEKRRVSVGKCTFCGEEEIAKGNEMLCEHCNESASAKPKNYPGPQ